MSMLSLYCSLKSHTQKKPLFQREIGMPLVDLKWTFIHNSLRLWHQLISYHFYFNCEFLNSDSWIKSSCQDNSIGKESLTNHPGKTGYPHAKEILSPPHTINKNYLKRDKQSKCKN